MEATTMVVVLRKVKEEVENDKGEKEEKEVNKYYRGSGIIFNEDKEKLYILTAGHVTNNSLKVWIYLFNNAVPRVAEATLQSQAFDDKIPWKDVAIVAVEKKKLGTNLPKPIPLAKKDTEIKLNQKIISCGCPGGSWPNAWLGKITGKSQTVIYFLPACAKGRSGSAICDVDGTHIIGLVVRSNPPFYSIGVPIHKIYKCMEEQKKPEKETKKAA
jgi:hypothetical protein